MVFTALTSLPQTRSRKTMRAPWGAEREGGEWRHVPPKAWGRMVPSWRDAGAGAMLARYSPADSERAD